MEIQVHNELLARQLGASLDAAISDSEGGNRSIDVLTKIEMLFARVHARSKQASAHQTGNQSAR